MAAVNDELVKAEQPVINKPCELFDMIGGTSNYRRVRIYIFARCAPTLSGSSLSCSVALRWMSTNVLMHIPACSRGFSARKDCLLACWERSRVDSTLWYWKIA